MPAAVDRHVSPSISPTETTVSCPQEIQRLVERFAQHEETYRSPYYNETQLRREFIDPFFKTLGWDVDNTAGYAAAYKDVIHEDAIKIGGTTKAPDYCFRIGGTRKFFVETKKPSVNIHTDVSPAFQLRRYAWTAKLALSILTDFEELAVYDCLTQKPDKHDRASTARIQFLRYTEFVDKWDEIASVFSKQAIFDGSFDKYAQTHKKKRGTAEVDDEFLKEIEDWRDQLARNLALRNELTQRDLNFAVQRTIDRIVFLRICEDRGIEPADRLRGLVNGPGVYARLVEAFHRADERYNSGLFHFQKEKGRPEPPDELTLGLKLDDRVLKDIIGRLYYPESPYEFSVLPADILGQVYEQFLGKVIRLTKGGRAKVEEKPEVKKAGGVYYTPTYIVQYIVQQTVGKLVEGRSPQEVGGLTKTYKASKKQRPLTVLDPACGSGSFLLGAYQFLLDWYRDRYVEDGADKHTRGSSPRLFQHKSGELRLTTSERKRILLAHIHGVDIDPQAVEVTKLSLLLKVLEGESGETLESQRRIFHERALPDLASNIKCGNSLIGPDFYDNGQLSLIDDGDLRLNLFDWEKEYAHVFRTRRSGHAIEGSGFDAVIGNPPWGQKTVADSDEIRKYIRSRYTSTAGIYDLFRPFVEKGVSLLRIGGYFGMVLPDIVLLKDYPDTRLYILDNVCLSTIDWWGMAFRDAVIDATTIVGVRGDCQKNHKLQATVHEDEDSFSHKVRQADFKENPRYVFNLHLTSERRDVIDQLSVWPVVGDYFEIHEGVHSGNIRKDLFVDERIDETCEPLLFGRGEISPYHVSWNGRFIRLSAMPEKRTRERYANTGNPDWHHREKVLVRRTGDYVLAAVDTSGAFASNNFFLVFPKIKGPLNLHGLCALLNSQFMTWYFRTIEPRRGRVFAEIKIKHLQVFPLPYDEDHVAVCERLNKLGADRAQLAERAAKQSGTPDDVVRLQRTIAALDGRIERAVCAAFAISECLLT